MNLFSVVQGLEADGSITDKEVHGYLPHYVRHLNQYATQTGTLLEIGVHEGASIRMWAHWLADWTIVGVDIAPQPDRTKDLAELPGVHLIEMDVAQDESVELLSQQFGTFDVIVDDGSHQPADQLFCFRALWPLVALGGWYIVEDLRTCFEPQWGGTVGKPNRTFDRLCSLLQAVLVGGEVAEFHAYEEIVFMRKAS